MASTERGHAALTRLHAEAAHCRECPLGARATQTVWGEGAPSASLMLVGEQPGHQEDLQGRPFVGPSGRLLGQALAQLGWDREIAAVRPDAILTLGRVAARSVMGQEVSVMRTRGQWQWRDDGLPVLVTLHPSALLRGDAAEREAAFASWMEDLSRAAHPPGPRGPAA